MSEKIKISEYTNYNIDLSNVPERYISILKKYEPYVILYDYVEDDHVIIKYPTTMCHYLMTVTNAYVTSDSCGLKNNNPINNPDMFSTILKVNLNKCDFNMTCSKDTQKKYNCSDKNPSINLCVVRLLAYYIFLKTYHEDEYNIQRQQYLNNKYIIDSKNISIRDYLKKSISEDMKNPPYIPYNIIQKILKEIDDHSSISLPISSDNGYKLQFVKYIYSNSGIDDTFIDFDKYIYYINDFNNYINNLDKQTKFINEFYDDDLLYILQYTFIFSYKITYPEKFLEYVDYIKNNPELEEQYNQNMSNFKEKTAIEMVKGANYYGYIAGNDDEEILDEINNKVFFLSSCFMIENTYTQYNALDCAQILAKTSSHAEYEPITYSTFEKNKIYVITGLTEFIKSYKDCVSKNGYMYPLRRQCEYFLKQLCAFEDNTYIILIGTLDEINDLFDLNESYSLIYGENSIIVEDKTIDELYDIYKNHIESKSEIVLSDENKDKFYKYITYNRSVFPFNNTTLAKYLANYSIKNNQFSLPDNLSNSRELDFMHDLDEFVGMDNIKKSVKKFYNFVKYQQAAKEQDINIKNTNLHMIFTGNPGTGKTSIARIIAKALYNIGIIKKNKIVEVERKDLVGQYIGQTAPKTADIIEKALDGVLFIDEAYALVPEDSGNDFGHEAIATLIKAMEDKKDRLVVIFAGYKYEMERFIESNPGIQSRIGYTFHFDDYNADQLYDIFAIKTKKSNLILDPECENPVRDIMKYFAEAHNIGNGRFVDKIYQMTLQNKAEQQSTNLRYITKDCIPSIQDVIDILPQKDYLIDPTKVSLQDKQYVVYHELGHAIVASILNVSTIKEISITIDSQNAFGHVLFDTSKDNLLKTSDQIRNMICVLLAGLAAEKIKFNVYTEGGSDLTRAFDLAKSIIFDYGQSTLGFASIYYKDKTDNRIFEEINAILDTEFNKAIDILSKNIHILDALYEKLIQNEKLSIEEITKFIEVNTQ